MRPLISMLIAVVCAIAVQNARSADAPSVALAAEIDRLIESRLAAEGIPPADEASDAEFLRRVYLDLHGVIPTREQAVRFLEQTGPDRRAKLIDVLLADARYGEHLADLWQEHLISPLADDRQARAEKLRGWLADQFNTRTWDRITFDLLTATGKIDENPAVTLYIEGRLPRTVPDLTDLTSRYFLGIRLNCAQCHDHPYAAWTQQDFWGMAAFFAQVQTPGRPKQVYQVGLQDNAFVSLASISKETPPDGLTLSPARLLGEEPLPSSDVANRTALAVWVTASDNPYFARAMVNRTWWSLFGRGLVDPVDDMHEANRPSHPAILNLLSERFAESGFDLKFLTRSIMLSRAYQRTSRPEGVSEEQAALFGRMSVKVLSAGQLYDSLATLFEPPSGPSRAIVRDEFVQFFNDDGDPDPASYRRGIPHVLRQMNSRQFLRQETTGLFARARRPGESSDDIADDVFLSVLSRHPNADELRLFREHIDAANSPETASRELIWSLIMSSEFSLNH